MPKKFKKAHILVDKVVTRCGDCPFYYEYEAPGDGYFVDTLFMGVCVLQDEEVGSRTIDSNCPFLKKKGTIKVVINDGIGGFGLSPEAIKHLCEKGSDAIEKHRASEDWTKDFTVDIGDGYKTDEWRSSVIYKDGYVYMLKLGDEVRAHPDVVEIVEKWGQKAWGSNATLKVIEIPDDIDWEIGENDMGYEWVVRKDGIWYD